MNVSVIICTWNNSRRLAITLDSLVSRLEVPDGLSWELVLVNNNCTDDTDEVVQRYLDKLPLVYVHEPKQGLSQARNAGLRVASGELLIFTDDDVKPVPSWLASYWFAYQEKGARFFFGGPIDSEFEGAPLDDELRPFAPASVKGLDYGREARALTPSEFFIGPNWACPAATLRQIGQFDTSRGLDPSSGKVKVGEERDLQQRLNRIGVAGWYVPGARLVHLVPGDKCELKHIANRIEAVVFDRVSKNPAAYLNGRTIGRIPRWMYKDTAVAWLKWAMGRMRGRNSYREYIELRRMVGMIKALNETAVGERAR